MIDWKKWKEKHLASLGGVPRGFARISFRLEDLRERFNLGRYQVSPVAEEIILQIKHGPTVYTKEWKAWLLKFAKANTKEEAKELFELLEEMKKKREEK